MIYVDNINILETNINTMMNSTETLKSLVRWLALRKI